MPFPSRRQWQVRRGRATNFANWRQSRNRSLCSKVADLLKPTLLLVDGHAYAYRAFYAIRNLRSPEGWATNAIYGFIKMLGRMRELVQPSHLAVVWDGGLSPERLQIAPEYKAHRPEMPAELGEQLGKIQTYLAAAGLKSLQADGVEADDWIAGLALAAAAENASVVIASGDKDFFQLVSDSIRILNPNDKSESIWTAAEVKVKTGVEPQQVVDWLSLVGDAVDNIPGVPGVGMKTAANLLGHFGTVDALYEKLSEVPQTRVRDALIASEKQVRINQQMIRLRSDLFPEFKLDDLTMKPANNASLLEHARICGFRGMIAELERQNELGKQPALFQAESQRDEWRSRQE
jgi:DNA polymerase-1